MDSILGPAIAPVAPAVCPRGAFSELDSMFDGGGGGGDGGDGLGDGGDGDGGGEGGGGDGCGGDGASPGVLMAAVIHCLYAAIKIGSHNSSHALSLAPGLS